ncbi:DUF3800 domain-containing protein [Actinoplanes sp. LDG1-06]|uniref:DUF3800 domain-containing protein n=2 Tax=Paractinoplanes ovalisporus TaxID=2810368 RepID=A0ABS2AK76_9ACTN|nr:DUF3800 domain-containing protein [Actinoplanes ovalisporus]
MQGGLPPVGAVAGPVVRIACDESGFSGTNLLDPADPVITHASVDLSEAESDELIGALRSRFRFSPHELKSGRLLRAGVAAGWFQQALRGRALVQVVDKEFFLVTRIADLLLAEPSYATGTRLTLDRRADAVALLPAVREKGLLPLFVELARTKHRRATRADVDRFAELSGIARERVEALPVSRENLEPLLPALAETVLSWSEGGRRVLVTHDEQSALTADRLTRLQLALAGDDGVSPLAGLVMADSRDDPRVQVADLLAGVARRGTLDPALLAPYPLVSGV